jgi:hypothetical protein
VAENGIELHDELELELTLGADAESVSQVPTSLSALLDHAGTWRT